MPFFLGDCDCCDECCDDCQQYNKCDSCCWCHPNFICVNVTNNNPSCSCEDEVGLFSASGGGCDTPVSYEGTIICGSLTIDLKFTIEDDGGTCTMFLESTCLGLTGSNRLSQSLGIANAPLGECGADELDVTFNVVGGASGCGDMNCSNLTIAVSKGSLIPNPTSCTGCDCLPGLMCVTYSKVCDNIGFVQWDEGSQTWTGTIVSDMGLCDDFEDINIVISLTESGGSCGVTLTLSGGVTYSGSFKALSSCPNGVSVSWDIDPGVETFTAVGELCGCTVSNNPCCPGESLPPLTLTATITDYVDCACATGEITLTWNSSTKRWVGDGLWGCENNSEQIHLEMYYDECALLLDYSNVDCGGTVDSGSEEANDEVCAPFEATFLPSFGAVVACCDGGGAGQISIAITE